MVEIEKNNVEETQASVMIPACIRVEHTLYLHPIVFRQIPETKVISVRYPSSDIPQILFGYGGMMRIEEAQALIYMLIEYIAAAQKSQSKTEL